LIGTDSVGTDFELPVKYTENAVVQKMGSEAPCRLNLLVYKGSFLRSDDERESRVLLAAENVRKEFLMLGPPLEELEQDDNPLLQPVHVCFSIPSYYERLGGMMFGFGPGLGFGHGLGIN
jgi:hypothetical protein